MNPWPGLIVQPKRKKYDSSGRSTLMNQGLCAKACGRPRHVSAKGNTDRYCKECRKAQYTESRKHRKVSEI